MREEDNCYLSCDDCATTRTDAIRRQAALADLNAGHGVPRLQLDLTSEASPATCMSSISPLIA